MSQTELMSYIESAYKECTSRPGWVMYDMFQHTLGTTNKMRFFDDLTETQSLGPKGTEMTYKIKKGRDASSAINDLFENTQSMLVTCQLVRSIALYKGLLDYFCYRSGGKEGTKLFNDMFNKNLIIRDYDIPFGVSSFHGQALLKPDMEPPIHPLIYFIDFVSCTNARALEKGDLVYFYNDPNYIIKHPSGNGRRIAAMVVGGDEFISFPDGVASSDRLSTLLIDEFNRPLTLGGSHLPDIDAVPGIMLENVMRVNYDRVNSLIENKNHLRFYHAYIQTLQSEQKVAVGIRKGIRKGISDISPSITLRDIQKTAKRDYSLAVSQSNEKSYDKAHTYFSKAIAWYVLFLSITDNKQLGYKFLTIAHSNFALSLSRSTSDGKHNASIYYHANEALFCSISSSLSGDDKQKKQSLCERLISECAI